MKYYLTKNLKSKFKKQIYLEFQNQLNTEKVLNIIQIGQNLSSTQYVNLKQKIGGDLGIEVNLLEYGESVNLNEIKNELKLKKEGQGLIIQLPIPDKFMNLLFDREIWNNRLDVDFLTSFKRDEYFNYGVLPPTIQGIDLIIRQTFLSQEFELKNLETKINLQGVVVGVVGQGRLVGGFMLNYLKEREATIVSLNQYSKEIKNLIQDCDILITATGQKGLVKSSMINSFKTKLIIDVGSNEQEGSVYGDLDYEDFEINSDKFPDLIICPSKGGVGPLTVLSLFWGLSRLMSFNL